MSSNESSCHDTGAASTEQGLHAQTNGLVCPISPPKTQRDSSPESLPSFLMSTASSSDGSSPIKIKKKGRFTVKTTVDVGDTQRKTVTPRTAKAASGKTKLRPQFNSPSPDKLHTPDDDNYHAFGLNLVAAPKEGMETIPEALQPISLKRMHSTDSYISDDSSSEDDLDTLDENKQSPSKRLSTSGNWQQSSPGDISMTYSPEHPHLVGKLLNQSPGKRSQNTVTFDETSINLDASGNYSGSEENIVHLIARESKESLYSESVSSHGGGTPSDNEPLAPSSSNNQKPQDQFELLPLPPAQRSSPLHVSSNVRPPTLQMRCNSEPLFSSQSGRRESKNSVSENFVRKSSANSTDYSSGESLEALETGTPLSLPESEMMMPSGRISPIHSNLDTPTPTQAEGAKHFYTSQQSAQKVAELQATAPLAHRPYLDYDDRSHPIDDGVPSQSFSNTNTPLSTILCYTEEEDHDHAYWKSKEMNSHVNVENQMLLADPKQLVVADSLHPSRWAMLFYISLLNLLSGWICFSVAPMAIILRGSVDAELLVSSFLVTSCVATIFAPVTLSCFGLRRTVLLGAFLLLVGLKVCCATPNFVERRQLQLLVGFVIVGISQPLYQITPIFVVKAWFPSYEHMAMLRIVLKSNQLGVFFSFLGGTTLVSSSDDILPYFQCISLIATALFIALAFHFEEGPPTPPTKRAFHEFRPIFRQPPSQEYNNDGAFGAEAAHNIDNLSPAKMDFAAEAYEPLKDGHHRNNFSYGSLDPSSPFPNLQGNFTPRGNGVQQPILSSQGAQTSRSHESTIYNNLVLSSMKACFSKEGFTRCSIVFITSGVVASTLITFMVYLVGVSRSSSTEVGAIGSAFQICIMISPSLVNRCTDPSQRRKLILAALLAGAASLVTCIFALEAKSFAGLMSSLFMVALVVGSLQSLSIGRGVETSQMSENSVTVIFQLLSNSLSAVAIPLFRLLQPASVPDYSLSFVMLIAMMLIAASCFFGGQRSSSAPERHPSLLPKSTAGIGKE